MKILYVEDEITKNIPRISRLFDKYLSKNAKKKLRDLENDDYPPSPEEVKKIVQASNLIEIEYSFPEALKKIIENHEKYSLFIIDRNLFEEDGYDFEEVKAADPSFTEEKYELYAEREGDYLLNILVYKTDVLSKFYFMTAYSAKEEIRGTADIQTHIDMNKFSTENFIEKGSEEDFKKLKDIIDNIPILNLQYENKEYLHILQKHINQEITASFLKILSQKDDYNSIRDNLNLMRIIYEQILTVCADKIPGMKADCKDEKGGKTIIWMKDKNHIDGDILRNFLFSIRNIANKFGSHYTDKPVYSPTLNTINALVYALKDIILWFGQICEKYKKT
ncbi:Uncharacterized protein dnl_11570 [Desulfonema limicola]|uniref:Uncharacterized protein n=1 Tax=Desulfonema limicola TaxID=45656 RepID=A0A975B504_9BACT|nr:hypothetical protein [Desulfonema limicola]QTA78910.1 Uncharacterized protein dnl_11570 [Desulfonema limicola]